MDPRPARLAPRLQPGDIAVLDQVDLDGATAQLLVSRRVAAVVNAAPSSSGRYPNLGPDLLVQAGVPLLDDVGPAVLTALRDGGRAVLTGDTLLVGDTAVARGMRQDPETVALAHDQARGGLAAQLADLAGGAVGWVVDERALLLERQGLPDLATRVRGRHALVVGPAYGAVDDLRELRRYLRRHRPVLVGVDGGADLLLSRGLVPDLVVGDPATLSDEVLRAAGEVVLRADAEGWDRVHDLAVPAHAVATRAASEDLALLLLDHAGAELLVTTGLPRSLEELLDRGRAAGASSLVARVAAGPRLLHAQAVRSLSPRPRRALPAVCVLLAAALAGSVAAGHADLARQLHHLWQQLAG